MASNDREVSVSVPIAGVVALCLLGGLAGLLAAFAVGPLADWLMDLIGSAPAPLELAAKLPLAAALPALILVGMAGGGWIASEWHEENGTIKVSADAVTILRTDANTYIPRNQVGAVFTDRDELVLTDARTNELLRLKTDSWLLGRLREPFQRFGYPWMGEEDPLNGAFRVWLDGGGDLEPSAHELLRARRRALADGRPGAAAQAREDLAAIGVAVRDRQGGQQYRRLSPGPREQSPRRPVSL